MTDRTLTAKRKLKVYGIGCGTSRKICAVSSQKEFASILGDSLHFVRGYASETGNAEEIKLAMGKPGTLFVQPYSGAGAREWREVSKHD